MGELSAAEVLAIERALCAAIGWVSAGINEGNHQVGQETIRRLQQAAIYFSRLSAPNTTPSDET